jgi:hypothetical protein
LVKCSAGTEHKISVIRAQSGTLDLCPGEIFVRTLQRGLDDFPAFGLEDSRPLGGGDRERPDFARRFTIDENPLSATRKDGSDLSVDDTDGALQMEAPG